MSVHENVEPLTDHPLFRALVLMGGGLAVGCGGIARGDAPPDLHVAGSNSASGGAPGSAAAGSVASVGGSGIILGVPAAGAGSQSASGAGGADVSAVYHPSCPYEQWDCRRATSDNSCYLNLKSKDDPFAAGCSCDSSRPTSAADCKSD